MHPDTNDKPKSNPILAVFLAVQLIIIVVIVAIVIKTLEYDKQIADDDYDRQPRLTIDGLTNIQPSLPEGDISNIERNLLKAVEENIDSVNSSSIAGSVRDDTLVTRHFGGEDVDYFSAIIDIPEIKQSYRIFHEYYSDQGKWETNPHEFLIISCLNEKDQIIFPDFNCKDSYDNKIYNGVLNKYIGELSFNDFTLIIENDLTSITIIPYNERYTENEKNSYIEQTKEAIRSLGISSKIFEYTVSRAEKPVYDV